jgi:epoxyqueuosine reductase
MVFVATTDPTTWILSRAHELGFSAAGIAAVEPMDPAPLRAWLDAGYGAEMTYLNRHLPLRADLRQVLPGAQSVIVVAQRYMDPINSALRGGYVACYARDRDYHDVLNEMLSRLWAEIRAIFPTDEGRIFVDGGPLPERELARRAGIGWPGAHSCLISEKLGTRFVLGEILTTLPLTPSEPAYGSCGSCFRCMEACPTGAIVAAGVVDARRCISYLTIEHKGSIPLDLRPRIGTRIFGCDTCQDACPYNMIREPVRWWSGDRMPEVMLIEHLSLTEEDFRRRYLGTPIFRTKRRGLLRNICVALGNLGDPAAIPALHRAMQDEEPLIREHAAWALEQITSK